MIPPTNPVPLLFNNSQTRQNLSAVVFSDNQYLWLGGDEADPDTKSTLIERLTWDRDQQVFRDHQQFDLRDYLKDFNPEDGEVDIEGVDLKDKYLWLVGSHGSKRKKLKDTDITAEKLLKISREKNRYILAMIPVQDGKPLKDEGAYLKRDGKSNVLIKALAKDDYLQDILSINLPGKDNGLDIEGLAVNQDTIFLGLRGPVLRGISILLEIRVLEESSRILDLKAFGKKSVLYQKHFLQLNGLGIRDLCFEGEDLLILAGPTMDLDSKIKLFRLRNPGQLEDNSYTSQGDNLHCILEIQEGQGNEKAEGITLFPDSNGSQRILTVYDTPDPRDRCQGDNDVLADVFPI